VRSEIQPEAPIEDGLPKKYVVMLEGRNYLVASGDETRRMGFFTTRHVEAVSGAAADKRAIREIRADPDLNARIVNPPADPPRLAVTRHIQVESFAGDSSPDLGYIFYEDHH
jgi:hypothetical protein